MGGTSLLPLQWDRQDPGHCQSGRGSMLRTRLLSNRCFANTYLTLKVIFQGESQSLIIQIRMGVSDRLSGCETGICFPGGQRICLQCRRRRRLRLDPWVGKRRAWQPTPVFLPGESHGQRSRAGYSPWGRKELDTTEATQHARTHNCLTSKLIHSPSHPSGKHHTANVDGQNQTWGSCVSIQSALLIGKSSSSSND